MRHLRNHTVIQYSSNVVSHVHLKRRDEDFDFGISGKVTSHGHELPHEHLIVRSYRRHAEYVPYMVVSKDSFSNAK